MLHGFHHSLANAGIKFHYLLEFICSLSDFGSRFPFAFCLDHLKLCLYTILDFEEASVKTDNLVADQSPPLQTSPSDTGSLEI